MEFDPGHAAFSYPRRPCKLDRSISWTGTTKNPIQYSSNNDLSYDYGGHSQTTEFFDVPSMFEDALRQLTSSPCFAYPPDSFQANSPLPPSPADHNTTVRTELPHSEDLEDNSVDLDANKYQDFWDTTLSLDTQQDFSSQLWPTLTYDNHMVSNTRSNPSGEPLEPTDDISSMPNYQLDQLVRTSSIGYLDPDLAVAPLETIDEEIGYAVQTMECKEISHVYLEGSMWSEPYESQNMSSNLFHSVGDESPGHAVQWQPLQPPKLGEAFDISGAEPDPLANKQTVVLVKVDVEVLANSQDSVPPPPPLGDLMSKFDSNPTSPLPKRKRRRYTETGKTKVKQVRVSGACIICKARKVPVSLFINAWLALLTKCGAHPKGLALHVSNWPAGVL